MAYSPLGTLAWAATGNGSLSGSERSSFRRAAVNAQLAEIRGRLLAALKPGDGAAPRVDTAPPDSALTRAAYDLAAGTYSAPLLQHCLRSWRWADLFAQRDRVTFDPEILYLACLLHDIALPNPVEGHCFAVTGGHEAERWLLGDGADERVAAQVADAIALHMNIRVPLELGPEAHLLHAGAHLDVAGTRFYALPTTAVRAVLAEHPRTGFVTEFGGHIRRQAAAAPHTRAGLASRAGMAVLMKRNPLNTLGEAAVARPDEPVGTAVTLPGGLTGVEAGPADGPPVLLLHGMMGGAWQFSWFQKALSEAGYRSLALNYRGHHDSRPTPALGRVHVVDYVHDALTARDYLGSPPVVVGQSMGGLIAQLLAARGAVRAAVLMCSLPPAGIRWNGARNPRLMLTHVPAGLLRRPLAPRRAELDDLIFNGFPAERRRAFFERQVPESSRAGVEIAYGAVRVDPAAVTCPVLSVGASLDRLVWPRIAAAIAERYRGDHLEIDNAGHYALVGEPGWENVAAQIIRWIDKQ